MGLAAVEKAVLLSPILVLFLFSVVQYYVNLRRKLPDLLDRYGIDTEVALRLGKRLFIEDVIMELFAVGIVSSFVMLTLSNYYTATGAFSALASICSLYAARGDVQRKSGVGETILFSVIGGQFSSFLAYPSYGIQVLSVYGTGFASAWIATAVLSLYLRKARYDSARAAIK